MTTTTDSCTSSTQAIDTYSTGNSLTHPLHLCDTCCAWIAGDWAKFEFQVCMSCPSRRDRLTAALETSHSELIAARIYPPQLPHQQPSCLHASQLLRCSSRCLAIAFLTTPHLTSPLTKLPAVCEELRWPAMWSQSQCGQTRMAPMPATKA